jgi:hypothetical protein
MNLVEGGEGVKIKLQNVLLRIQIYPTRETHS